MNEPKPAMEAYADIGRGRIAELRELLRQSPGPREERPDDDDPREAETEGTARSRHPSASPGTARRRALRSVPQDVLDA